MKLIKGKAVYEVPLFERIETAHIHVSGLGYALISVNRESLFSVKENKRSGITGVPYYFSYYAKSGKMYLEFFPIPDASYVCKIRYVETKEY